MNQLFQIAGSSITGRDHIGRGNLLFGKNNQDVFSFLVRDTALVAVVCDGCSEGSHSEFGAQLGAHLVSTALIEQVTNYESNLATAKSEVEMMANILEVVRTLVLAKLKAAAGAMAGGDRSLSAAISEYFLFTTVGAVMTRRQTVIFSIGDGVFTLNGSVTKLGPFPGNAPPYLAYALVRSSIDEDLLHFQIQAQLPTEEVQSLLIGSDGIEDLIAAAEQPVPGGRHGAVGPLSQFWEDDRYFKPDQIRRRLALINSEVVRLDPETQQLKRESGVLPDDTTLIVIRRQPSSSQNEVE